MPARDTLYWHFPHYHGSGNRPSGAVRAGPYKLIEFFEDGTLELYNLRDDPGEQTNRAGELPARAAALYAEWRAWRDDLNAPLPK